MKTTYVPTMGGVEVFGPLLRLEASWRELGAKAETVDSVDGAVS